MRSRVRLWIVAFTTALLISALAPFTSGVSWGAQPPILVVISPPPGLGLPVGQHVGVRYWFTGKMPATLELAADGVALISDEAQPGQEVTHAWTPANPGPHQLHVRAFTPDGTALGSASLTVIVLPIGSRVRVPNAHLPSILRSLTPRVPRMREVAEPGTAYIGQCPTSQ